MVKLATHVGSRYEYAVKLMTVPAEGAPTPESGATRKEILNEIKILATIEHATCLHMKARKRSGRTRRGGCGIRLLRAARLACPVAAPAAAVLAAARRRS